MKRSLLVWVSAAFVMAMAGACVQKGSVTEKTPLSVPLANYPSASVEVDLPTDMKNAESKKTHFQDELGKKLEEKKLFSKIAPGSGDMIVRVKVTKVDTGNEAMQKTGMMANSGAAEIAATVELLDKKQDKVVGAFDVTGNSKSNVRVAGDELDDTTSVALSAAGDQIVAYLESHRGAGK